MQSGGEGRTGREGGAGRSGLPGPLGVQGGAGAGGGARGEGDDGQNRELIPYHCQYRYNDMIMLEETWGVLTMANGNGQSRIHPITGLPGQIGEAGRVGDKVHTDRVRYIMTRYANDNILLALAHISINSSLVSSVCKFAILDTQCMTIPIC